MGIEIAIHPEILVRAADRTDVFSFKYFRVVSGCGMNPEPRTNELYLFFGHGDRPE
jgi:hypothetical protein